MPFAALPELSFAPYRLSGSVYGVLMNQRSMFTELSDKVNQPPYNGPPQYPVLYIKPRNTLAQGGDVVRVPAEVAEVEVGASLGVIMGRPACRVPRAEVWNCVAGYLIVNDVSIPHPDYFRPAIRYKARDGFCPLGKPVSGAQLKADPDALEIVTFIDDKQVQVAKTRDSLRGIEQLVQEVSQFMTLAPGDILTLGVAAPAPRACAGQTVRIEIQGLPSLTNKFLGAV